MFAIIFRVFTIYIVVLLVLRLMGKRQLGEMQPFEFVITLIIADIATMPMTERTIPLLNGIVPVITLLLIHFGISFLIRKSICLRTLVSGKPVIVMSPDGIEYENLKKLNMTLSDLSEMLRTANCTDMSQVSYAIVETNGKVNIVLKSQNQPATLEDLKIEPTDKASVFSMLVCDGKTVKSNITNFGLTVNETLHILKDIIKQTPDVKNIILFSVDENGNYYLQTRNKPAQNGTVQLHKNVGIQP